MPKGISAMEDWNLALATAVGRYLEGGFPAWVCRACIADALTLSVPDVKLGLLLLAHLQGRGALDTACTTCEMCSLETAVVRAGRPRALRLVA